MNVWFYCRKAMAVLHFADTRCLRRNWLRFAFVTIFLTVQLVLAIYLYKSSNVNESSTKSWEPIPKKPYKQPKNRRNDIHINHNQDDEDNNSFNKYSAGNNDTKSQLSADTKDYGSPFKASELQSKPFYIDELDFQPNCKINTKEAISALQRASTQKCKQEIASIVCKTYRNQLYPTHLPRYCYSSNLDGDFGDYLGCFRDKLKARLLTALAQKLDDNSPMSCLSFCMRAGYQYAGVEYATQCFCGHTMPKAAAEIKKTYCNMSCPSPDKLHPSTDLCGGYYALDVYKTGLSKRVKIDPRQESEKSSVKIAFVFTVNGRAIRQLRRLLNNLYSSKHYYLFHVDERQTYLYRELETLSRRYSNIKLMSHRMSTIWGGASLLRVLRNAIKVLLTTNRWNDWDFMINLSESDFPIKSLDRLEKFLTANRGKNFVKSHGQDTHRFITKQGLDKTFYECDTHMWRLGDRKIPAGIQLDGGSDWVALSYDFCHYLTYERNELLRGLDIFYNFTLLPAESYFHTVLQNSHFCDTVIDNNLHVTNWKRKQGCKCQYKHIVDWCGCSPNDYLEEDWSKVFVTQDKPIYFARKFEAVVNQQIVNHVERWIGNSKFEGSPSYNRYWENVYVYYDKTSTQTDNILSSFSALILLATKQLDTLCDISVFHDYSTDLKNLNITEASYFFERDNFKGVLISFSLTAQERQFSYEFMAVPQHHFVIHSNEGAMSRLISLQVCSNFDLKEELFRNFACILSPFSEISAMHKWTPGSENITFTFVWIDPAMMVAGSYEVKVESNPTADSMIVLLHKPAFRQPLRPGYWKLLLMHNWAKIAETKFLILPFLYNNGNQVTSENVELLNSGPKSKYVDHNFTAIEEILGIQEFQTSQSRVAFRNSKRYGKDLIQWTEKLVSESFEVQNICIQNQSNVPCRAAQLPLCHNTKWSSYSPDPKSDFL